MKWQCIIRNIYFRNKTHLSIVGFWRAGNPFLISLLVAACAGVAIGYMWTGPSVYLLILFFLLLIVLIYRGMSVARPVRRARTSRTARAHRSDVMTPNIAI